MNKTITSISLLGLFSLGGCDTARSGTIIDEAQRIGSLLNRPATASVQESQGLRIELTRCGLAGNNVTCEFSATEGTDHELYILNARVILGSGTELRGTSWSLGASSGSNSWVSMPAQVAVRGSASFDGVPPTERVLSLLEITFSIRFGSTVTVRFRNVPMQ